MNNKRSNTKAATPDEFGLKHSVFTPLNFDTVVPTLNFQVYQDVSDEWRWTLKAGADQMIAISSRGFRSLEECMYPLNLVERCQDAKVTIHRRYR